MKIVLYPPVSEDLYERVRQTAPEAEVMMADEENVIAAVADAEVLFGFFSKEEIQAAQRLKWIQSTSAGMEKQLDIPEVRDSDVIICSASGLHAIQVAEHAWALTAALFRGLYVFFRNQLAHRWQGAPLADLYGATAGIVGFGGIGRQYAQRAQAFRMRILAVDVQGGDKPAFVESLWGIDRLDDLLKEADVVCLACPHTPETEKLIDARALKLMKKTAFLVNTARGPVVDEAALIEALKAGEIAGAGLDVFEVEPLPAESPLWDMENVIVTTHSAGGSSYRHRRTVEFFCENLKRYLAGEPLLNEVDKTLGYPLLDRRAQ
jgi:D-3-phosphoglycerate dehydrogenase